MLTRIAIFLRRAFVCCCALLALGVAGLWVRSYWRCDEVGYYTYKPAPPGKGRDVRNIVGSNRGRLFCLRSEADITCEVDWYGGEPTEVITSGKPTPQLAWFTAKAVGAPFVWEPRWRWAGFRLDMSTSQPPGAWWYQGAAVPHWVMVVGLALPPAMPVRRRWIRRRRRKKGLCLNCGYDVRASGDVCSECGQSLRPLVPAKRSASGRRRRRAAILAAGVAILIAAIWLGVRGRGEEPPVAVRLGPATTLPAGQLPHLVELHLGKGVTMRCALIPAGRFLMGSPAREAGRDENEVQHEVTIGKPFYMGVTVVTQEQYEAVMGTNPSYFKGTKNPVEQVSWNDAVAFCNRVSEATGRTIHLPTEAQWEYACRAGTTTPFYTGWKLPRDQAHYDHGCYPANRTGDYLSQTMPVASFRPNAWGLFDMHGNVWEWCSDWYGPYLRASTRDSSWPDNGTARVLRGGSWYLNPQNCRSALRLRYEPGDRNYDFGFRVSLDLP